MSTPQQLEYDVTITTSNDGIKFDSIKYKDEGEELFKLDQTVYKWPNGIPSIISNAPVASTNPAVTNVENTNAQDPSSNAPVASTDQHQPFQANFGEHTFSAGNLSKRKSNRAPRRSGRKNQKSRRKNRRSNLYKKIR